MFTGIIEELGTVAMTGSHLEIRCRSVLADLINGASIAVNGVCVTAVRITPVSFGADLSPEFLYLHAVESSAAADRVKPAGP